MKKFVLEDIDEEEVESYLFDNGYVPGTIGEILTFFAEQEYLFRSNPGCIMWMESELKKSK